MDQANSKRSTSASRTKPPSRPSTPLRPSSRTSLRDSRTFTPKSGTAAFPLESLEPAFAELSDSMADLEANFMHLQLMHESLSRFGESFASFLYGLNMNAFVVDFPEAPLTDSIKRWQKQQRQKDGMDVSTIITGGRGDETTVGTGDTSFASMKATPRRKSAFGGGPPTTPGTAATSTSKTSIPSARGGIPTRTGRGGGRVSRGSGLPRGRGQGAR